MHPFLRASALVVPLASILLFVGPFSVAQHVAYALDQRPEQTILFIGNSRTSANDMPQMMRRIADSAEYTNKLRVELHAPSNESMTGHAADPGVRELLAQDWDHVVLQAQSTEVIDRANWGKWLEPATELIALAEEKHALPAMFVTWRYTDQCSDDRKWNASQNAAMHTAIQEQHAWLARNTGVGLVNVGLVWDGVLGQQQDFSLYIDCNHPSVYGSYLSALMLFGTLLGGDVSEVTYVPDGVQPQQAELLRKAVSNYLHEEENRRLTAATQDTRPTMDESGKGAVLCLWSIYISIEQGVDICGLEPRPSDADLRASIDRTEAFILENTTTGITTETLSTYKADVYDQTKEMLRTDNGEAMCRDVVTFRENIAEDVTRHTNELLSISREPLWNPCI
jgi:hypothetical protein